MNFDETAWGPDVDKFNPDRWDDLPETATKYNYLTFFQGPRSCIAQKFAEIETKVLLIELIKAFRFDIVDNRHVEKEAAITTRPKHGMHLRISTV